MARAFGKAVVTPSKARGSETPKGRSDGFQPKARRRPWQWDIIAENGKTCTPVGPQWGFGALPN
jgi:hypothetical protein